jgi:hypothetical protein
MPPEYNGIYYFDKLNDSVEGNRPVYQMNGKCVWWHQQFRHWWVGSCENVGLNTGYAYAKEDSICPSHELTWRRGGSNEFLNGAYIIMIEENVYKEAARAESYASTPDWSSATSGINAIIRNGRYKQTCRPVYKNGKFKCS